MSTVAVDVFTTFASDVNVNIDIYTYMAKSEHGICNVLQEQ